MSYSIKMAQDNPDRGYFRANVISTLGSKPIEGAKVQISDINFPDNVIEEVTTDSSGQTEAIELPAPPLDYSMNPTAERPYSIYNIKITVPGYETLEISGAEILSGQTALQNASLVPIDDALGTSEETYVIPPHTLYGDYPPKIPENEIKDISETGEIVLSRVVIPAGV